MVTYLFLFVYVIVAIPGNGSVHIKLYTELERNTPQVSQFCESSTEVKEDACGM